MIRFNNDYNHGALDSILSALTATNADSFAGYGEDIWCQRAETVIKRLSQSDTERGWSQTYQQSYAIYRTEGGSRYFLWYQDDASVQQALSAAQLLGVNGVSIWRLGTIPTANTAWTWNGLLA